jgi:DNA-binding response OmpR family regulator
MTVGAPDVILVVDDDVDIARFIKVNLNLEGYDVLLPTTARRRCSSSRSISRPSPSSTG